jgi:hypothetical protein
LLHFDPPTPLAQGCGAGADATQTGPFNSVASRTAALLQALEAVTTTDQGWVDTNKPGLVPTNATVELTIYRLGNAVNAAAFGTLYSDQSADGVGHAGFRLSVANDGTLSAATFDSAGATSVASSASGAIAVGVWHQVAASISSNGIKLLIDGAQAGTAASPLSWTQSSSTGWAGAARVAGGTATARFNGRIDELRVSNVARY